ALGPYRGTPDHDILMTRWRYGRPRPCDPRRGDTGALARMSLDVEVRASRPYNVDVEVRASRPYYYLGRIIEHNRRNVRTRRTYEISKRATRSTAIDHFTRRSNHQQDQQRLRYTQIPLR